MNSNPVIIVAPIIPCFIIDISQGIYSLICPIRKKQNPPNKNIDQ